MEDGVLNILMVYDQFSSVKFIQDLTDTIQSEFRFTFRSNEETPKSISTFKDFDVCVISHSHIEGTNGSYFKAFIPFLNVIPMIVITDYNQIEIGKGLIKKGFTDYLLKVELTTNLLKKSLIYSVERHRIKKEMLDSEKRYSELFYNTPLPMMVFDVLDQKVVKFNHAATQVFGFTEEELKSFDIRDLRPIDNTTKNKINFSQSLQEGEVHFLGSFKYLINKKDIKYFDIFVRPLKQGNREFRLAMVTDVTQRELFDQQLSKAIFEAQETERFEIGAELHDNVCQILTAGQLSLDLMEESVSPENLFLAKGKHMFRLAIEEIRRLSHRLAPAFYDDSPLEYAISGIVEGSKSSEFNLNLNISNHMKNMIFSREVQLNIFRILQEQIQNISKHANAKNVQIDLNYKNGNLLINIVDDGVGFDPKNSRGGIGLNNIKRRIDRLNGEIQINSSLGNGCEIKLKIPKENILVTIN